MKYKNITIAVSEETMQQAKEIANYYNNMPNEDGLPSVPVGWDAVIATQAEIGVEETLKAPKKAGLS